MKKIRELDLRTCPGYSPANLIDHLSLLLVAKSDYALAQALELPPPTISKIRNRQANVTAGVLLRMHDVTKVPVDTLRSWMGLPSYAPGAAAAPAN